MKDKSLPISEHPVVCSINNPMELSKEQLIEHINAVSHIKDKAVSKIRELTTHTESLNTELEEVKRKLDATDFWERCVYPEGADAKQIQNELTDYHFMMKQVPEVYCELTGGRMSYTNYYAKDVIAQAREVQEKETQEAIDEATEDLQAQISTMKPVVDSAVEEYRIAWDDDRFPTQLTNARANRIMAVETYLKNTGEQK